MIISMAPSAVIAVFQKSLSKPTLYLCGENRHVMRFIALSLYHKSRQKANLFSKKISLDFIKPRLIFYDRFYSAVCISASEYSD
jgi:hypothetical protein